MSEVTRILDQIEQGDLDSAKQLFPLIYEELRKLAAARLANEKPGQTFQATALVHEVYLRLVDNDQTRHWTSRRHFFAAAAEAMRRILIDQARRKGRLKRGGGWHRVDVDELELPASGTDERLIALDEALDRFAEIEPEKAELIRLRSFAGLGLDQAAALLGISPSTADRWWAYGRAWLRVEIEKTKSA
jgi:RNA polymerase sigma factor (TIGR02999 family)